MYEYKYVTIKAKGVVGVEFRERREVIDQHARDGWRYAGWVPAALGAYGTMGQIDLIFEREV